MTKTVAIIGGSFNPPTLQHLIVSLEILRVCPWVDEVWYLPSNHHPHADRHDHKAERPHFKMRLMWVQDMVQHMLNPKIRVCDIEQEFEGPCYAKDVLERLMERNPKTEFHWVVGTDCLHELHEWQYADWLSENVGFIAYPRPGYEVENQKLSPVKHLHILSKNDVVVSNISSTFVRNNPDARWALPPNSCWPHGPNLV